SVAFLREVRQTGWWPAFPSRVCNRSRRQPSRIRSGFLEGRRSPSRMFRPTIDGRLEARALLSASPFVFGKNYAAESAYLLKHPAARNAFNLLKPRQLYYNAPFFARTRPFRVHRAIATQTARGGQAVQVTALDGSHYTLKLSYTSNTLATNIAEGQNGQLGVASAAGVVSQVSMQNAN